MKTQLEILDNRDSAAKQIEAILNLKYTIIFSEKCEKSNHFTLRLQTEFGKYKILVPNKFHVEKFDNEAILKLILRDINMRNKKDIFYKKQALEALKTARLNHEAVNEINISL